AASERDSPLGDTGTLRYRLRRLDGHEVTIETHWWTMHDEAGMPLRRVSTSLDVTEQDRLQQALVQREQMLASAELLAHLGSWEANLDEGTLVYSEEGRRIFGQEDPDWPKDYRQVIHAVHEDDRDRVTAEASRSLSLGVGSSASEYRIVRPDGSIRHVISVKKYVRDEHGHVHSAIGTVLDVTDTVEATDALRRLRKEAEDRDAQVADILDSVPSVVVEMSEFGVILHANPAVREIFGWEPEALVGRHVSILAANVTPEQHDAFLAHFLQTGEPSTATGLVVERTREVEARRYDGSSFPADLRVQEGTARHGQRRFIGVVNDITERKAAEARLLQAQKSEALGTLVAGVAHDFNNLLTAIGGSIDLAQEGRDEPDEWLERASLATDRAAALVRQLLQFARQTPQAREPVNIRDLVDELVGLCRATFDRRIELLVPIEDPASRDRILQMLELPFRDTVKSRELRPDGLYERRHAAEPEERFRSQESLYRQICEAVRQSEKTRRTTFLPYRKPQETE
ncbi:MAG: PAS domain S-box protein, partial [Planctomycetes bacterium]|nr:PAS domain S-box protein [Planctomycetota bacterium]